MFIIKSKILYFNRKFIFDKAVLGLKRKNICMKGNKSMIVDIFEKDISLVDLGGYPAFFRFLTKKSFSLVRRPSFDFLRFSLISVDKFLVVFLEFIRLKINFKKMTI